MPDDIFSGDKRGLLVFKTGYGGDLQVRSHHRLREAGVKSGFGLGRLVDVATTEQK